MSEFRKPSIVEEISPAQGEAFVLEHAARVAGVQGETLYARHLLNQAEGIRKADLHRRIVILFDRSDKQNAIIDVGLHITKPLLPAIVSS